MHQGTDGLSEQKATGIRAFLDFPDLLQPSRLYAVQELRSDFHLVPGSPGIYGWWFSSPPPGVPLDGTLLRDGRRLLYVGIAPQAPAASGRISRRTLRDRLKNHCCGPIGSSTLRRTLACLLAGELAFGIRRHLGRLVMDKADEARLTAWMDAYARVCWHVHPAPWTVEDAFLSAGPRLPLNIKGSNDPFRADLRRMRSSF